ncbi:MAG: type II toxin-antitoxin system Phd/YefM family antitoxin [Eubacterium sp.]|nr:type II toxin-antitoxin system Phd/YefM family antitoxin [Eubacterium sp.]
MPLIRPITDLRNTGEISELCHNSNEPIFITKNGYGDMVVMSNETYEKSFAKLEIYEKLLIGKKQIEDGEVTDGEEVFAKLREKYNYAL